MAAFQPGTLLNLPPISLLPQRSLPSEADYLCLQAGGTPAHCKLRGTGVKRKPIREEMPCAVTALQKWERHLNFLSPELVVFNIFDASLDPEERKAMSDKLYGFRHQWHPGDRLIYGKSVPGPNFCTGDAFWPGT